MPAIEINRIEELTDAQAKGPVLLDCYAAWCLPCGALAPKFDKLSDGYPAVSFLKFDVDKHEDAIEDHPISYDVEAMPTFLFYVDGHQVDKFGNDWSGIVAAAEKHFGPRKTQTE